MTRTVLDTEIARLEDEIVALGHLVNTGLSQAMDALEKRDLRLSEQVVVNDRLVNGRRHEIEMTCLGIIARQHPMATDLRILTAIIAIAAELERINDYAKGIAKISLMIGEDPLMKRLDLLPEMHHRVQSMLERALISYIRRDVELARQLAREDVEIDHLYQTVYRNVFQSISEDSGWLAQGNYLVWVAHNLERAADRVVNICERTVFVVTGLFAELEPEKTLVFPLSDEYVAPD